MDFDTLIKHFQLLSICLQIFFLYRKSMCKIKLINHFRDANFSFNVYSCFKYEEKFFNHLIRYYQRKNMKSLNIKNSFEDLFVHSFFLQSRFLNQIIQQYINYNVYVFELKSFLPFNG